MKLILTEFDIDHEVGPDDTGKWPVTVKLVGHARPEELYDLAGLGVSVMIQRQGGG